MSTDTLAEVLIEEAEAIVRAEWERLLGELLGAYAQIPAVRPEPRQAGIRATTLGRPGAPPASRDRRWTTRRRPGRVWPTQRSPPMYQLTARRTSEVEVMP